MAGLDFQIIILLNEHERHARASIGVGLTELVNADDIFAEVNSYDKSVIEKMALVDQLEEKEKTAFFQYWMPSYLKSG